VAATVAALAAVAATAGSTLMMSGKLPDAQQAFWAACSDHVGVTTLTSRFRVETNFISQSYSIYKLGKTFRICEKQSGIKQ
jgi:hypothetical protein